MAAASQHGGVARRWALGAALACTCAACEPGQGLETDGTGDRGGPASDACEAAPGEYVLTHTAVSDDCGGVAALPSERYRITTEGEVVYASGRAVGVGTTPNGCVDDDVELDGCAVSFTRLCGTDVAFVDAPIVGTADVQGDYTLDFDALVGSLDIRIAAYDGVTLLLACQAQQRIRITAL